MKYRFRIREIETKHSTIFIPERGSKLIFVWFWIKICNIPKYYNIKLKENKLKGEYGHFQEPSSTFFSKEAAEKEIEEYITILSLKKERSIKKEIIHDYSPLLKL